MATPAAPVWTGDWTVSSDHPGPGSTAPAKHLGPSLGSHLTSALALPSPDRRRGSTVHADCVSPTWHSAFLPICSPSRIILHLFPPTALLQAPASDVGWTSSHFSFVFGSWKLGIRRDCRLLLQERWTFLGHVLRVCILCE